MSGGVKFDQGKPRTDLISPIALFSLARLLTVGAVKYTARNWELGMPWSKPLAAIIRHTLLYMLGETIDPETGESHMTAVMCEAHFLVHYEVTHPQLDDRPKYKMTEKQIEEVGRRVEDVLVKS